MTAELNVEVMDVSLPESDLFYTNWFHYDGIANYLNGWKALLGAKRFWNFCITKVFAVGKNIREMRNGILCSVKNRIKWLENIVDRPFWRRRYETKSFCFYDRR